MSEIEPSVVVVGNGTCAKAKIAELHYVDPSNPNFTVDESCWKFIATPAQGANFLRLEVHVVMTGYDSQGNNLTIDETKTVSAETYTSHWYEAITGESPDASSEYTIISAGTAKSTAYYLTDHGIYIYDPATTTFTVTAYFSPENYHVYAQAEPANGNTVKVGTSPEGPTSSADIPVGTPVEVVATPAAGYRFVSWSDGGAQTHSFTIYGAITVSMTAYFALIPQTYYQVTTSSSPANGGITSGDGSYESGTSCTITATPNAGYLFSHWEINGTVVLGAPATYTFTVTEISSCVAFFVYDGDSSSEDSSEEWEDGPLEYSPNDPAESLCYDPTTGMLCYYNHKVS